MKNKLMIKIHLITEIKSNWNFKKAKLFPG